VPAERSCFAPDGGEDLARQGPRTFFQDDLELTWHVIPRADEAQIAAARIIGRFAEARLVEPRDATAHLQIDCDELAFRSGPSEGAFHLDDHSFADEPPSANP
jgi:hypothetical protein